MGTFDSVYLNKIRHLEEENQQLKNILNEYFAPAFIGKSPEEIAQILKPKNPFEGLMSGPPMSPEEWQKRRESQTREYREMKKRGVLPKNIEERPIMNNPPEPAPIDGRDVYRRANAGRGDGSYMPSPSKRGGFVPSPNKPILDQKPKPGDAGPQLTPEGKQRLTDTMKRFIDRQPKPGDAGPMPRPQGRSEPAPYASDDMESRRAEEAERVRGERLRNELRGGGPQYRPAPPKSVLSFW